MGQALWVLDVQRLPSTRFSTTLPFWRRRVGALDAGGSEPAPRSFRYQSYIRRPSIYLRSVSCFSWLC